MGNVREHIYLAALLHDIGKFYQRADTGSVITSRYLKEHCKDEGSFCPNNNGVYTHKHVLWTAQFIEDYSSVFKPLVGASFDDLSDKDNLINLASGHHLKYDQLSELGKIIKEADCLSSGMDRDSDSAFKDAQDENTNWNAFKQKSMTSILETINLDDKVLATKTDWRHLPVFPMRLDKTYFPSAQPVVPDYEKQWEQFKLEFKHIQADTYHAFSETMLNLLFKYTSCIPASTINFADVSLYDHLKTTAAIAVCLYDAYQSGEKNKPFLLIGADFSGIQSYIYQIVSKYAGKNLKGRSFYLRLLSDTVVRYLLKELGLYQANIVYNSGGGFYLLAPNTEEVKSKLRNACSVIEKQLFENHGTSLFVAIDSVEVSKDAFLHNGKENLGTVWKALFDKRDKKKSHKFSSVIKKDYQSFFEPIMQGADANRDIITGEEFLPGEKETKLKELKPLREITKSQIELGEELRETDAVVVSEEVIPYWNDKFHIAPIDLGFTYYFIKKDELNKMKLQLKASADKVSVITFNGEKGDCNFMCGPIEGVNNIYGLEFYGGNEIDAKGMPTFEDFCKKESDDAMKRLGVLRMDVDNLGNIFQKGIAPERATLSRYAALSRSFDFFFSGYLNTIWREVAPEKSFIIYSGGDDVFIVGSWEKTIEIAERIRKDFREFACDNPAFSISGGIAIETSKFPIMKGAEESDSEEKNAKEHKVDELDKNSISFMDFAMNWDKEFPKIKALKDEIVEKCTMQNNPLPRSFMSKVLMHFANAEITNHKFSKKGIRTYWLLAYDLSRMQGRQKDSLIENCKTEVCGNRKVLNGELITTDYHSLELWAFACRWAEIELRTNKK